VNPGRIFNPMGDEVSRQAFVVEGDLVGPHHELHNRAQFVGKVMGRISNLPDTIENTHIPEYSFT